MTVICLSFEYLARFLSESHTGVTTLRNMQSTPESGMQLYQQSHLKSSWFPVVINTIAAQLLE